jgi:hypothetical protein
MITGDRKEKKKKTLGNIRTRTEKNFKRQGRIMYKKRQENKNKTKTKEKSNKKRIIINLGKIERRDKKGEKTGK